MGAAAWCTCRFRRRPDTINVSGPNVSGPPHSTVQEEPPEALDPETLGLRCISPLRGPYQSGRLGRPCLEALQQLNNFITVLQIVINGHSERLEARWAAWHRQAAGRGLRANVAGSFTEVRHGQSLAKLGPALNFRVRVNTGRSFSRSASHSNDYCVQLPAVRTLAAGLHIPIIVAASAEDEFE
jgi:hypothetical protein